MKIFSRLSAITGFVLIGVYLTFMLFSLALFPTAYSPMKNWLSDLGNSSLNPTGAILYNLGCIFTAILEFPFMMGLSTWNLEKKWQKIMLRIGQVSGCIAGFCLIMTGIFSEDFMSLHMIWSAINVIALCYFTTFVSVALIIHSKFWRPVAIVGLTVATIDMVFGLGINIFIMEWLAIFGTLLFVGLLAANMLKIKKNHDDQ